MTDTKKPLVDVVKGATKRERLKVARSVLADPAVASHPSVKKALVTEQERAAKQRVQSAKQRAAQNQPRTTVGQYFWRLVDSCVKISRDLGYVTEDLKTDTVTLDPGQRDKVLERLTLVRDAAQAGIDVINGVEDDQDVIEATISVVHELTA